MALRWVTEILVRCAISMISMPCDSRTLRSRAPVNWVSALISRASSAWSMPSSAAEAPSLRARAGGEELGRARALRGEEREDAARDALDVAGALRGGAVDEERLAAAHGEPHGVVVFDVAEVIDVHAEEALGDRRHRRAELQVRLE